MSVLVVGSMRAVRLLKHNPRWAAKLEKQRQRREIREAREREREERARARQEAEQQRAKVNPFAAPKAGDGSSGAFLFGGAPAANPFSSTPASSEAPKTKELDSEAAADDDDADEEDDDDASDDEADRLAEELEMKANLADLNLDEDWTRSAARYPPLYLNTVPESSSSAAAAETLTPSQAKVLKSPSDTGDIEEELKHWSKEGYEKMFVSGVDDVFERFAKRVGNEGRQCVRYEFGGQPLPFSSSGPLYAQLWPLSQPKSGAKPGSRVPVTRQQFGPQPPNACSPTPAGGSYDASGIPPCPACGGPRTFEMQLMPNLVNTLKVEKIERSANDTDAEDDPYKGLDAEARRKAEIERILGRNLPTPTSTEGVTRTEPSTASQEARDGRLAPRTGLHWSTAMVFVCEKDCCLPTEGSQVEGETWREEWIGLQFED